MLPCSNRGRHISRVAPVTIDDDERFFATMVDAITKCFGQFEMGMMTTR